jgi:Domain of unknown function (DUF4129)
MIPVLNWSDAPPGPPLDPTAQQARAQLSAELSKPEYQAARPSGLTLLLQQAQQSISKWLDDLFNGLGGAPISPDLIVLVIVVLAIVALVVLFLVFGLPRINRRSAKVGALFGDEDDRDSVALRRAAERSAAARDYTTAIAEEFRSIARALAERTVITTFPGTTASGFAAHAGGAFPDFRQALRDCAAAFDDVRYLGAVGTEAQWQAMSALELGLRSARPSFDLGLVDA